MNYQNYDEIKINENSIGKIGIINLNKEFEKLQVDLNEPG